MEGGREDEPLFETKVAKGRLAFKAYALSVFAALCFVWIYRASEIIFFFFSGDGVEAEDGRSRRRSWVLLGMFLSELWFGFYWLISLSLRWNITYRSPFKHRLSRRYEDVAVELLLPRVDVFVCTADPLIEPPAMVVDTVLSAMAYDYPPEKLAVYLSDDGGSELTFYAMLEASRFAASWLPFCRRFKVQPASPAAYFAAGAGYAEPGSKVNADARSTVKGLYEVMKNRIDAVVKVGRVPHDIRKQHKGFMEWNDTTTTPRNHHGIVQILIHGTEEKDRDEEGLVMPKLVYVAREKRPYRHHNFKAGAMNSLIRVSSEISGGEIILNVDCDMYNNNSDAVRDAVSFFMDEKNGHDIAFIQLSQQFSNLSNNDIYGGALRLILELEFHGMDGQGGAMYIGSGCFHRRASLCGLKYSKGWNKEIRSEKKAKDELLLTASSLEERAKSLVSCTCEDNTDWGKEVGLKYGCPVEDVITGLSIQCRGWKSIYFNPLRKGFIGVSPTTLSQALVQHKRWAEGHFQIFMSKYCPLIFGRGKIGLGLRLAYSVYGLWAPCSFPTIFYTFAPPICLLGGVSLFPKISSLWFVPFAYVVASTTLYNLGESIWIGMTAKAWWNDQRFVLYKKLASYPFAVVDAFLQLAGARASAFVVTPKVADDDGASRRYAEEKMDFAGAPPLMLAVLVAAAGVSLLGLLGGLKEVAIHEGSAAVAKLDALFPQFALCGAVTLLNVPLYEAVALRRDAGRFPAAIALFSCLPLVLILALSMPMKWGL